VNSVVFWYVGKDEIWCLVTGRSSDGRAPDSDMRWMTIRDGERIGLYPSYAEPPTRLIGAIFTIRRPASREDGDGGKKNDAGEPF